MTGLEFFQFAAGTSALISSGTSAFATIYGTIEGTRLAEDQAKLEQQILLSQAGLQNEILGVQKNIFLTQQEGVQKTQDIDLQIKQARADLEIQKIQNEMELTQASHQQNLTTGNYGGFSWWFYVLGATVVATGVYLVMKGK